MKLKFRIANIWSIGLADVKAFYTRKRRQWKVAGGSPDSNASDNGGGLQIYSELFETKHKEFGSLRHDKEDLTQPNDKPYNKLEHEEESSEDPHSPNMSFKTEGDEHRRSNSTAPSTNSAFTPVNPNNASTPTQMDQGNSNSSARNGTRPSYGPPIPQGPQQSPASHTYPGQPQYGQPTGYGYAPNTPAYPQSTPAYGLQPPYAQTSGPSQGRGSSSYDPQALRNLEMEGNRSLINHDLPFFESDCFLNGQSTYLGAGYPFDQVQPQSEYLQDAQNPYMYPNQWPGPG